MAGQVTSKMFTESAASVGAILNYINSLTNLPANPNFSILPRGSGGFEVIVATS